MILLKNILRRKTFYVETNGAHYNIEIIIKSLSLNGHQATY